MFDTDESFNLFKGYSIYTWLVVIFQVLKHVTKGGNNFKWMKYVHYCPDCSVVQQILWPCSYICLASFFKSS